VPRCRPPPIHRARPSRCRTMIDAVVAAS
jgi:hypothetical protein